MVTPRDRHGLPAHALAYAVDLNWSVFPLWWIESGRCACGSDCGKNGGKHPIGRLAHHGVKNATTDPDLIQAWWRRYPRANIGLACGASFWALDIDTDAGLDLLTECEDQHGWLAAGPASRTGSGWQHQLFTPDPRLINAVKPVPGLDTRTAGGYIVAPPSRHLSGGTYAWLPGREPWEVKLPTAPEWLITLVTKPKPAAEPVARTTKPRPLPKVSTRYLEVAVTAELQRVATAGEGQRNSSLFVAAAALGRFVAAGKLDARAIGLALVSEAVATGLPRAEAERTVLSGLDAALRGAA